MSYEATAWAYAQSLRTGPKFVLVALADFADESMSCYPGQKRLAEMTGMTDRAIRSCLVLLEAEGYLVRQRRYTDSGPRTSDRYILCLDRVADTALPEESSTSPQAEESSKPEADSALDPTHRNLLPVKEPLTTGTTRHALPEESSREPLENHQLTTKRTTHRRTRAPDSFVITAALRQWANAKGITVDLEAETESFLDNHRAKDNQFKDWTAAWREWMRRAQRWRGVAQRPRDEWIEA